MSACPIVVGMGQHAVPASDVVRRFIFEKQPVRGHWVRLEGAWRELRAHADYPPVVSELLGEAVAASVLLAATLKFRGTLTFQLQGNGAVGLLVAQCAHDFRLRAVARYDGVALQGWSGDGRRSATFRRLVGTDGRITVTIEAEEKSMRYQGVVPLAGTSLGESLEAYFASSEQLPTREEIAAAWEGAQRGIERLTPVQLLQCSAEQLLARGFTDHDLRLFRGSPVRFECRCSQGRVAGLLRALGAEEVRGVLQEQGAVTVTCEFCHRPYRFDAADVEALFAEGPGSEVIH